MLTIKKLKLFQGMEGEGFNLDLYLNGKKIAFVMDGGNGGVFNYDFISPAAATEFVDIVNAMGLMPVTIDMAVDELINDHQHQKRLARARKTSLIFTTAACGKGDFMSVKHISVKHDNADTELLKFKILKKHPDAVFI